MRYFVVLLSFLLVTKFAFAQNAADTPILEIINSDADKNISTSAIILPTCDDEKLTSLVQKKISEFQAKSKADTIFDKRQQILISKNLNGFQDVVVAGFKPETNFDVANKIIMSKINDGLSEKQMRLCASEHQQLNKVVYLFIHPTEDKIKIDIINLFNPSSAGNGVSLIY